MASLECLSNTGHKCPPALLTTRCQQPFSPSTTALSSARDLCVPTQTPSPGAHQHSLDLPFPTKRRLRGEGKAAAGRSALPSTGQPGQHAQDTQWTQLWHSTIQPFVSPVLTANSTLGGKSLREAFAEAPVKQQWPAATRPEPCQKKTCHRKHARDTHAASDPRFWANKAFHFMWTVPSAYHPVQWIAGLLPQGPPVPGQHI
jgi:hypothetical protein